MIVNASFQCEVGVDGFEIWNEFRLPILVKYFIGEIFNPAQYKKCAFDWIRL